MQTRWVHPGANLVRCWVPAAIPGDGDYVKSLAPDKTGSPVRLENSMGLILHMQLKDQKSKFH